MSLQDFPRYPLLLGPSPIHPLERLTEHLGGATIWAKREDCNSGLAVSSASTRRPRSTRPASRSSGSPAAPRS